MLYQIAGQLHPFHLQKSWLESIRSEWFACMAQKTLSPACTRIYIGTISKLSEQLLGIVVNLTDDKVISCGI